MTNIFWYSPLPKPASAIASWTAWAQSGVDGECLRRIGFPAIIGGIQDLNGIQKGKFHGMIARYKSEIRFQSDAWMTYQVWVPEVGG